MSFSTDESRSDTLSAVSGGDGGSSCDCRCGRCSCFSQMSRECLSCVTGSSITTMSKMQQRVNDRSEKCQDESTSKPYHTSTPSTYTMEKMLSWMVSIDEAMKARPNEQSRICLARASCLHIACQIDRSKLPSVNESHQRLRQDPRKACTDVIHAHHRGAPNPG